MGLIIAGNHVGIVVTPALGQRSRFVEGFDPRKPGLSVPWSALRRIEAADPWPGFRVTTRFGKVDEEHVFHPLHVHGLMSFTPKDAQLFAFESVVRELFAAAEEHAPAAVANGWFDVPDVAPEPVESLPEGGAIADAGVYRNAGRVVARRGRPGVFRIVRAWLASSPEKPWRFTTREVVMTDRHFYARSWGGHRFRVPIHTLRARLNGPYGDVVYVFGRRNFVVLPERRGCELQRRLDDRVQRTMLPPPQSALVSHP